MGMKLTENPVEVEDGIETTEYSLVIDGVVELRAGMDSKQFFDGLLDAIIDYVEKHNALAGLSLSHQAYKDPEEERFEEEDGTKGP
ncbi:MAG: hypothetical protein L0332_29220 [Chloroflexi bacterium]|nr:hypothetical protein [Chloroflexota bacterium]MCI0649418.1 hypothetical protein [Chloroflexota bacterium]MCI0730782.1 hypothetical protein [Chloroflexota bacterium]